MKVMTKDMQEWTADDEVRVLSTEEAEAVNGGTLWLLGWLFGGWGRRSYSYGGHSGGCGCGCGC